MSVARRGNLSAGRMAACMATAVALVAAVLVIGGSSPAQAEEVEIVQDVSCQGANAQTTGLLKIYFKESGGILNLETPMTVDAPEELTWGTAGDVTISSQMSIPPEMAEVQESLGVTTTLLDSDVNVQVAGGADALWEGELPPLPPPGEVIVVSNTQQVTPTTLEPITYTLLSPFSLSIQIAGGIFTSPIVMSLTCTFSETLLATTAVVPPEGWSLPEAPTEVTAVGGSRQALVSWAPPAGEPTPPITGYVVTADPGGKTVETSALVTSVDVIGLEPGEDYTFTVEAVNLLGPGAVSDPTSPVSISEGEDFSDVPSTHAFFSEIEWLAATGITEGFEDETFRPENTLNRQGMAAFLYRLSGNPEGLDPTCETAPFSDVPVTNPFCGEIQWMKDEGITTGGAGNNFNPGGGLNRQAMSAYLYRLANGPDAPPACTTKPFPDVPTSNQFCPQITWMAEVGITTIPSTDDFGPDKALKRQAMAAFLYRYSTLFPTGL